MKTRLVWCPSLRGVVVLALAGTMLGALGGVSFAEESLEHPLDEVTETVIEQTMPEEEDFADADEDVPAEPSDTAINQPIDDQEPSKEVAEEAPNPEIVSYEAPETPEAAPESVPLEAQDEPIDLFLCYYEEIWVAYYRHDPVTPKPTITYEDEKLKEGVDYTLSYENNDGPTQEARVIATGIGRFEGELSISFRIDKVDIWRCDVSEIPTQQWKGKPLYPKPVVTYEGVVLKEGVDYERSYEMNDTPEYGTGYVVLKGIGDFANSEAADRWIPFDITGGIDLIYCELAEVPAQKWTGKPVTPKVRVTYGKKVLREGVDYVLSYSNNVNTCVREATVTVKGIGMYYGEMGSLFDIVGTYLNASMVKPIPVQKWTGKQVKPKLTLTYKGKTLKEGVDFTVTYINNVKPCTVDCYKGITGMATAILQGKGGFSGDLWVEFSIAAGPGTWKKTSGKWWYKYASGGYPRNTIVYIDGKMYLFDRNGYLLTGWRELNHRWYYAGSSGALAVGWKKLSGKWYFFDRMTGRMAQWLVEDGGKLYLCDFRSGEMRTGWGKVDGKWYYFESSGVAVAGWKKLGGAWYYFNPKTHVMQTGWKKIDGKHYYFDSSGAMVSSKWVGNYYLQADGSMATNKWIGNYYVGADGKWVKGKTR